MQMLPRNKRKERPSPEPQIHDRHDVPPSSSFSLPPGYRFVPTEEELILAYLIPFLQGSQHSWPYPPVHHMNIYESNPEQLTETFEKGNQKEWFFISQRTKRHEGGKRQNRSDNAGYWHATDGAKKINLEQEEEDLVGYKTALAYYVGKPPNGVKSNWLMTEYYFPQSCHAKEKVDHALYKIYLSPQGIKKKRLEEEEINKKTKKKKKREEGVATVNLEEKVEQQPQQETTVFPPPHGQDYSGFGTLMTTHNNDTNNNMLMSSQEGSLDKGDGAYFDVVEFMKELDNMIMPGSSQKDYAYFDFEEFLNDIDNGTDGVTQQQS